MPPAPAMFKPAPLPASHHRNPANQRGQTEPLLDLSSEVLFRCLLDHPGGLIALNSAVERLTGYTRAELYGSLENAARLICADDLLGLRDWVAGNAPVPRQIRLVTRSGRVVWTAANLRLTGGENGSPRVLEGSLRAVEEPEAWQDGTLPGLQENLTGRVQPDQIQTAIFQIAQSTVSSETLHELYRSIHAILGGLMPVENFFIALYDPETGLISYPYFMDEYDPIPDPHPLGSGLTAYVIRTGQPLLASPEVYDALVAEGKVESIGAPSIDWLGVPLVIQERIIGILAVQSYTEGVRFTETEKEILRFVSNQIALVIERKRTEEGLRLSESRYRGIVEDQTELICRWTEDGRLTFVNEAFCRQRGLSRENLLTARYPDAFHPDDAPDVQQSIFIGYQEKRVVSYEARTLLPGGKVGWESWTTRPLFQEDGLFLEYQSVGQEITDRKQREHELEAIAALSAAVRTATSRVELLPVLLDQLVEVLHLDAILIGVHDSLQDDICFALGLGLWSGLTGRRLAASQGLTGRVMDLGQPLYCPDLSLETRLAHEEEFGAAQSAACSPLIANRQSIGVLWAGKKAGFSEHDIHLLAALADITANAVHRSTLHEQTQLRLQRLSALRAIDMAISASLDVRLTLAILLDQITIQLGVDAADVLRLSPETQMLEYADGRGFKSNTIQNTRMRIGQGFAGRAALEREIVYIPDLSSNDTDTLIGTQFLLNEQFACYTAVPLIAKGQVRGVLEMYSRKPASPDAEWLDFMHSLGANTAIAIDNAEMFDRLQRSNAELSMAYDATIEGWAQAVSLHDQETFEHHQRVANLTVSLAQRMRIYEGDLSHWRRGALLHDIGKLAIPDAIVGKAGPLTPDEWEIMRQHPILAYQMLSQIAYLRPALDIPLYHHERWDGSGYPHGLREDAIPLSARVFAVIDVWDALINDRRYRKAWTRQEALNYLREQSGIQFDPQVVKAFLQMEAPMGLD